jgi:hypothetical protein
VSAREDLAVRQAALVAALVAGAPPPPDLDAERIRIQSAALLRKRGRCVLHAAPELAAALGESFEAAFARYAASGPKAGSSADDAAAFARFLLGSALGRGREVRRAARGVTRIS